MSNEQLRLNRQSPPPLVPPSGGEIGGPGETGGPPQWGGETGGGI